MVLDARTRRRRTHDKTSRKSFAGKIGRIGRKTGKPMKENLRKDSMGFDALDEFFDSSEGEGSEDFSEDEFESERDAFDDVMMGGGMESEEEEDEQPPRTPLGARNRATNSASASTAKKVSRRRSARSNLGRRASVVSVVSAMEGPAMSLSDTEEAAPSPAREEEVVDDVDEEIQFKEVVAPAPAKKKAAPAKKKAAPKRKAASSTSRKPANPKRKSLHPSSILPNDENNENGGLRRSGRQRMKPLARWRNERVVYKRRLTVLPTPVEVIHVPEHQTPKRRRTTRARTTTTTKRGNTTIVHVPAGPTEDLPPTPGKVVSCEIMDSRRGREVKRAVAVPKASIRMFPIGDEPADGGDATATQSFVGKAIDCSKFSSGLVELNPGQTLPNQDPGDNTESFYVTQGQVMVKIFKTKFTISQGGFFYVPPQNCYAIKNVAKETRAILAFTSVKAASA